VCSLAQEILAAQSTPIGFQLLPMCMRTKMPLYKASSSTTPSRNQAEGLICTRLYPTCEAVRDKPRFVSIDKHDLPVTASLHAALLRLRNRSIERIIWVDAVCINQQDLKEREQQVHSMAKIYGKAKRVIVWLGEAAGNEA
jgi:hypothetical protein